MIVRIFAAFLLTIVLNNSFASTCGSLWVDDISNENDGINSEVRKMAKRELLPVTVIPKAIITARQYEKPGLMISQLVSTKVGSWKVVMSDPCDIENIEKLRDGNLATLNEIDISDNKNFVVNLAGADIWVVVEAFSKQCKIPVEAPQRPESYTRVWVSSGSMISCMDYLDLISINGIKIISVKGKLVAEKD